MGTGTIQLHFHKETEAAVLEKSQNCHIFDFRGTKLFRCFLPHGNLCKVHFVDEAPSALCGIAYVVFLHIDLYSEYPLRFIGKAEAATNAVPSLHSLMPYTYPGMLLAVFQCHIYNEDGALH